MILEIIADYDYGELNSYLKNHTPNISVLSGNQALEKKIRKLLANRVTVVVEDEIVLNYTTRKMGISNKIKIAGTITPQNKVGITFSPKNLKSAEYARILSEGIQKLRKSGELKKILDKYYVSDWK
jgi:polar amino acid transport system substrate-binding protein